MTFFSTIISQLLLILHMIPHYPTITEYDWKVAKEEDGVTISTRKMEDTGFKQVKAEMEVEASVETCVALIADSEAAPKWMNRIEEFKTLERVNDTVWYTYGVVKIPWPFSDKDIVSQNTLERKVGKQGAIIQLESAPDYLEKKDGRNRIQHSRGSWEFTPMGNGQTKVVYRIFAEPNDFLPPWLVNMVVVGSIHKTLVDMRGLLVARDQQNGQRS